MCGIAGIHFKCAPEADILKRTTNAVDKMLEDIESRGRDSTGICYITTDNKYTVYKQPIRAKWFIPPEVPKNIRTVLLHTRLATQGSPIQAENNHPVRYQNTIVTHNGHINNDDALFKDLHLTRHALVDSEAIAAVLHQKGLDTLPETLKLLAGSFAFAAVSPKKFPGKVVLVKGPSSPLEVCETDKFVVWGSTPSVVDKWFKVALEMPQGIPYSDMKTVQEGEIGIIDHDTLEWSKYETKPFWPTTMNNWRPASNMQTSYVTSATPNAIRARSYQHQQLAVEVGAPVIFMCEGRRCTIEPDTRLTIWPLLPIIEEQELEDKGLAKCTCGHVFKMHVGISYKCATKRCGCAGYQRVDFTKACLQDKSWRSRSRQDTTAYRPLALPAGESCELRPIIKDPPAKVVVQPMSETVFVECVGCNDSIPFNESRFLWRNRWCATCYTVAIKDMTDLNEGLPWYPHTRDEFDRRHIWVCEKVGQETNEEPAFVNYMVFELDQELDPTWLWSLRDEFEALYLKWDSNWRSRVDED